MKKLIVVTVVVAFVVLITLGCDSRRAKIEENIKRFKVSSEVGQQQEANRQIVLKSLEQYRTDFGVYPKTLDELETQGYDVPQPSDGWTWEYAVDQLGMPQVSAVPKQ